MKDVKKTVILVGIILAIIVVIFLIVGNFKYGTQLLTRTKLTQSDPTVSLLLTRIENSSNLRRASLSTEELTSEEIIKYVLDIVSEEDYSVKNIKPKKILCEVNNNISFNAIGGKCSVLIIENDKFMEYQNKYLGLDKELEYKELKYNGMHCKNDGNKYYCLQGDYTDSILGYSSFKEAYSTKDNIVILEYYLKIDVNDKDRCLKYFDSEYCENYEGKDKPIIDEETIKSDGVLYEHTFKASEDNYYLEKSFIVAER